MPTTTNLGMAVSSDQRDYVLEYWMKMLNEQNGNFVLLDNEFGVLSSKLAFTIYPASWVAEEHAPFYYKSTVTINAIVQDNSIVEAYFEDILVSTGVILHSVTQNGTQLELVFYADAAKQSAVSGFVKYVYSVPGQQPLPVPESNVLPKTITENGTYDAHNENADGYNPVTVNIPDQLNDYFNKSLTEYENEQLKFFQTPYPFSTFGFLQRVSLPNLRIIKDNAFASCGFLKTADFPKCIEVGYTAFQSCFNLVSISFPECLSVNTGGFSMCSYLTEISFPNCIYFGGSAFTQCVNLRKVFAPNALTISYYSAFTSCPLQELIVPKCGYLSAGIFSNSAPKTLTKVDVRCCSDINNTFSQLDYLPSISLPGCISMSSYAFYNCISLSVVQLFQASVPALQYAQAFSYTPMSQSSYLGHFGSIFVPSQAVDAYKSATNWAVYSSRFAALSSEYDSRFVYGYEFYDRSDLTAIPSEKQNVEMVCNNAFQSCVNLTEANLSECGFICRSAFAGCSSLSSISFPKCSYLGAYAFQGCSLLEEINFPEIITFPSNVISGCTNIKKVIMPNLRMIYPYEFKDKLLLSSISFPKCLSIGGNAFQNCSALTEANFPECLSIGGNAFNNCSALTEANFPECSIVEGNAFWNCYSLSSISFPKCKKIGTTAFANCSALIEANFPECETFEFNAFSGCGSLTTVIMPKCTFIPDFSRCYRLKNIIAPNALSIGGLSQTGITSVSFPKCTYVDYATFEGRSISTITLPECLGLNTRVFSYCTSLTEVNLPKCMNIGDYDFYSCHALLSVNCPECLTIGSSAFYTCSALTEANFPKCESVGFFAFQNCSALTEANFPECSRLDYYAFSGCYSLSSINFPKCKFLGTCVFQSCSRLTEANFPECLSIGQLVFSGCSSLSSISFPKCKNIGQSAFQSCSSLTEANFPECLSVLNYAFQYCGSLRIASFPKCSMLSTSAFNYCSKLSQLYLLNSSVATLGNNVFLSTPMSNSAYLGYFGSIYVRASLLTQYQAANNWSRFSSRFVGLTDEEIAALDNQ